MISFREVSSSDPSLQDRRCPICFDDLFGSPTPVVAHPGDGDKHPVHQGCAKRWTQQRSTCPSCRVPIEPDSVLSDAEKAARSRAHIMRDAFLGATCTAALAAAFIGPGLVLNAINPRINEIDPQLITRMTSKSIQLAVGAGILLVKPLQINVPAAIIAAATAATAVTVAATAGPITAVSLGLAMIGASAASATIGILARKWRQV